MGLKELVLSIIVPLALANCTTKEFIPQGIVKSKYYHIGIAGTLSEEVWVYNNQKIEIISIRDKGRSYQMIFAPKDLELINLMQKYYKSNEIDFITPEKTEKVIIN